MQPYYADDCVTLYHGDCLEVTEWLSADVLVTDPPYGVAWRRGGTTWYGENGRVIPQEIETIEGDRNPGLRDAVLEVWGSKPAIVFGSWRVRRPMNVRHRLIWHKLGRNPGPLNAPWFSADEEIYVIGDGFTGHPTQTVYQTSENRAQEPLRVGHPTPKPVSLMDRLISKCPPGVVADPFTGSGSTLVAAKALGRQVVGVEIDERYCEVTANRLAQDVLDFAAS